MAEHPEDEDWKAGEDAIDEARELEESGESSNHRNGGVRLLNLIRGYVLLLVGCGLVVWGVIPPAKAGALTMGGALVGFNPLFRATIGSGSGHHGG
jgi:hypothetical protein